MIELSRPCPSLGGAPITVKVHADSITSGASRLITWEWIYPRMIHSEVLTHRALSKNSASSRAIPAAKLRERVETSPAVPFSWGQNQRGMQAGAEIDDTASAEAWWLRGRDLMAAHHAEGEALGLHKQIVNRVIEPWMTIAVIVSATDHANLFHLRKHSAAEPHFQILASLAWELFHESMPVYRAPGEWHLPLVDDAERERADAVRVSTGRCARVSYLTHDGRRDPQEDAELHDRLVLRGPLDDSPLHSSPAEHPALAVGGRQRFKNFEGWRQYRAMLPGENGPNTDERCPFCGCWGERHVRTCAMEKS